MHAYLDNSATTVVDQDVAQAILNMMLNDFGNPSSMHRLGVAAEKRIKEARRVVAKALHVKDKEIYFTSGGTEANNIALRGIAAAHRKRGSHLITSAVEHPAVLNTIEDLKNRGFEVTVIPVDEKGMIRLDALEQAITDQTILVSVMHVNNEVGTVQPIEKIVKCVRKCNPNIKIHVDAIQSFGKLPFHLKRLDIDALSISAHKFHGPKGVGALYLKEGIRIEPVTTGGGQEKGLRPGTENVPGIIGMAEAIRKIIPSVKNNYKSVQSLKERMHSGLVEALEDLQVNSFMNAMGSPYILNVSFNGIRGEVLLHALEEHEIYVSTGSACSSNQNKSYSHVLNAMGLDDVAKEGAIRFSFSCLNTEDEIDYAIQMVVKKVKELDKIIKGR